MKLSDFELEVMQHFWEHPESSAPNIHLMIEPEHQVSYSTVKTIIDRLEKKGALKRSGKHGRTIFYSPTIKKNQLRKPMIKDFIQRVFLGNSKSLVVQLIEDEDLSLEDISFLESLLEKQKKDLK